MDDSAGKGERPASTVRVVRGLLAAYWIALFLVTHVPLPPRVPSVAGADKVFHAGAYAGLAFLLALLAALRVAPSWRQYTKIFALVAAYGAIDELLQIPVGRTCDVWDWLADIAGAAAGLLVFAIAASLARRFSRSAGS